MCTYHLCFQDFSVKSCRENKVFVKNLEIYSLYLNKSPGTNLKTQSIFKPMSPTLKNKRNKKKEEREIPKCVALTWYFFFVLHIWREKIAKIVTFPSITEWCSWPFSIKLCAECIKSVFQTTSECLRNEPQSQRCQVQWWVSQSWNGSQKIAEVN